MRLSRSSFARRRGFTLVEVLAALLFMGIVIPVAMQAVSVSSRVGILSQRKAAATRVAERLLEEMLVTHQVNSGVNQGSIDEGNVTYPWTMVLQQWSEDAMMEVTMRVSFEVQGNIYDVGVTTLYDSAVESEAPAG